MVHQNISVLIFSLIKIIYEKQGTNELNQSPRLTKIAAVIKAFFTKKHKKYVYQSKGFSDEVFEVQIPRPSPEEW